MRFVKETAVIFGITLVGECLNRTLPFPVPAGVYGLFILLLLLCLKIVRLEDVAMTGDFLLDIMPLMFIPAGAGLMNHVDQIKPLLLPLFVTITVSTLFVMVITGRSAQFIIRKGRRRDAYEGSSQ